MRTMKEDHKQNGNDWKQVSAELKSGSFAPVYLLCGEQAYLKNQYRDRLKTALLGDGDKMNVSAFSGRDMDLLQITELADTLPFFADRRIIILENSPFFGGKGSGEAEKLAEYLKKLPETTHFILLESSADARTKLYKTIASVGRIIHCDTPSPEDLARWAAAYFQQNGLQIRRSDLELFLEHTGEDMLNIRSEADKLIAYCLGQREITREDLEAIGSVQVRDRIFGMIDAVINHKPPQALEIYMDLLKLQTAPQAILALMIRQINQLLQIRELSETLDAGGIASRTGLKPFVVRKLKDTAAAYQKDVLKKALEQCLKADVAYKSGKMDAGIAVESLILEIAAGEIKL